MNKLLFSKYGGVIVVFCPNCGAENNDTAKFCKQCGNSLSGASPIKDTYVATGNAPSARISDNSNFNNNSSNSNSNSDNKNLIIICLTIVICAILIAGALVLFSGNDNNDENGLSDSASLNGGADDSINESADDSTADSSTETSAVEKENPPRIYSGSFSTGSSASAKTDCTVYVGSEHAGEKVKISVLYSYGGSPLNQGKIVPKTVSSSGYVTVKSANALDYYPDEAYVTLYDSNGNTVDTKTVYLTPTSGTQTFN